MGAALAAALTIWGPPLWLGVAIVVVATSASLWSAVPFAEDHADPGWVCMDETAGTALAAVGLFGWPWVAAMLVSRVIDITKAAPGMKWAENLPGTAGITADDLLAGLYGLGVGWLIYAVI